jgi:hypothetical protein
MAKKTTRKTNGAYAPPLYKAYLFKDKDPSIYQLRNLAEEFIGEKVTRKNLRQIETAGGPKIETMHQWFYGKTKRPTNAALEAAGRAIGWERKWSKMK